VKEQNYPNYEHIIFDNCSNDSSREVLESFAHLDYHIEKDRGQSDALNKGFKKASGDIIGWLNADDFYLPDTFEKVNAIFNASPEIDAVYSNVKFVDENGNFERNLRTHGPVKWMSVFYTYIQSTSFFFRRHIIENNQLLDENLHLCMDMEFYIRLLFQGYRFKHIDDYFASFRWHDDNKSGQLESIREKNLKEIFYILNKTFDKRLSPNNFNKFVYRMTVDAVAKPIRQLLIHSHY